MLKEKVKQTIKKYNLINPGDNIIIGVSGGPDSICLLHILNELKNELGIKLLVCHINHMMRKEADSETEYVKKICENMNIQCFVQKVDVQKQAEEQKLGTEEMGRNVRYSFFEEVAKKTNSNKIATAHNSNDKVETVLMNMLRGSGLSGLKGIEPIRDGKFIRPLIETEREEIEKYCEENNLNPKYDKTNNENIYTRNKIRNELIPYIKKEFNENILRTINRLSEVATEENEYLEKQVANIFEEICVNKNEHEETHTSHIAPHTSIKLDLKEFNKLELVIKRRVILYTINKVLGTTAGIEKINIDDIIKLCKNNIGNKYLEPTKNIKILLKNKKISFIPKSKCSVGEGLK